MICRGKVFSGHVVWIGTQVTHKLVSTSLELHKRIDVPSTPYTSWRTRLSKVQKRYGLLAFLLSCQRLYDHTQWQRSCSKCLRSERDVVQREACVFGGGIALVKCHKGNRSRRGQVVLHGRVHMLQVVSCWRISRLGHTGYLLGIHTTLRRSHSRSSGLVWRRCRPRRILHGGSLSPRTEDGIHWCGKLTHSGGDLGLHPLRSANLGRVLVRELCRRTILRHAIERLRTSSRALEVVVCVPVFLLGLRLCHWIPA